MLDIHCWSLGTSNLENAGFTAVYEPKPNNPHHDGRRHGGESFFIDNLYLKKTKRTSKKTLFHGQSSPPEWTPRDKN